MMVKNKLNDNKNLFLQCMISKGRERMSWNIIVFYSLDSKSFLSKIYRPESPREKNAKRHLSTVYMVAIKTV